MTLSPDTMGRQLAEIERRLRVVETAQRAPFTSISDDQGRDLVRLSRDGLIFYDTTTGEEILRLDASGLSMYDDQGDLRTRIGEIASNYGMQVLDAGGTVERLRVDERGFVQPYFAHPWYDPTTYKTTTSATFEPIYRSQIELITSLGVYAWIFATGDAATTGEIRLRNATSGTTTDAVAVPAGGSAFQQFRWLHGEELSSGPIVFDVEARRTSGAAGVNVYMPAALTLADPGLCVADGVP
jgi:hypothetical protein